MLNETREPPAGVTPFWTQETVPYISFHPNVLGLGQTIILNAWISPSMETNRRFMNNITKAMMIQLTKPDGTKVDLYLPNANSEATSWTSYTVDQIGTWQAQFFFLGTYFPQMLIEVSQSFGVPAGTVLRSLWCKPSTTAIYQFTVQADQVSSWPPAALPNEYWEWPIDFSNREWWQISAPWPGEGGGGYNFGSFGSYWDMIDPGTNPYAISQASYTPLVAGPESGHILRLTKEALGGMYGGLAGTSGALADAGYPGIVYQGRCYQTKTVVKQALINGTYREQPVSCATCFDLRTGEIYYQIPTADGGITPTYIGYDQGGGTQSDITTYTPEIFTISGSRLYKINPWTGAVTTNTTISPLTTSVYFNQADEQFLCVINAGNTSNPNYRLINWTTLGSSSNYTTRIYSNTSYAMSSLPTYRDWTVGLGATVSGIEVDGVRQGQNCTGYNLYTGQKLWSVNVSAPQYSGSATIVDHGKLAILSMYGKYIALDLATGNKAWETQTMNYPFGASAFGVYGVGSANGLLFRPGYDGLWAFNWTDGSTAWYVSRMSKAPFESTYTNYTGGSESYPGQTQVRIADQKVYIYDGEHSPQQPRTRGWSLYCYDIWTGNLEWELPIGGAVMFSTPPSTGPIVDGYLYFPATDGITYIIGKGKSATTVTAPDVAVPLETAFTIKGTVLDQSPAQPGTPCVSKDSMKTQMSYLHLQYAIDGLWHNETITGVPVALSAIGEDGTYYNIGTVTTDGYYGTFSKAWTPPKEGTYKIIASFAADESYGSSAAATSVTVGPKVETNNGGNTVVEAPDNTNLLYGILAAVVIAIIIGLAAIVISMRKR